MGVAWKYWQWVRLDPSRGRAVAVLAPVRDFFHQQFGDRAEEEAVNDKACQSHLLKLVRYGSDLLSQRLAEVCLRCFIANQIDWICNDLTQRFGKGGGFDHYDLLSLVLDDVGVADLLDLTSVPANDAALATQILQSFDPSKAQLSTWCRQMLISHLEFSAFLKASGICLESDWSILNNMGLEHLHRILQQQGVSSQGIEQAVALLKSYQAVYRRDRLQQKQSQGTRGRCRPPTSEQLDRIIAHLQAQGHTSSPAEKLLERLQAIAHSIRQFRRPQTVPLDLQNLPPVAQPEPDPSEQDHNIFLKQYRQAFQTALEEAIAHVIQERVAYHQRKKQVSDRVFLLALQLLHCEGKSMGEIAEQVQLKQQYQVSRLLELKTLRADVRRHMLGQLGDRIRELAADYIDPARLHRIDETLNAALEVEVDAMILAAEKEATTAQSFRTTVFSQALCRYLDTKE